jgi:branched-subunit amino acid aminotransferase/4-amino-4-deoxychorismate lyase
MRVIIDGVAVPDGEAAISVFDWALQRGFGCFEVVRAYDGVPFRLEPHLLRLARSADALSMEPPDLDPLGGWVEAAAAAGGDCLIRVMATGGGRDDPLTAPARTVVLWEPLPEVPVPLRLGSVVADWHPGHAGGMFSGVKWLSYAPNMATSDAARRAGHDDALLLTVDGTVLEGPTFGVAWVIGGVLETPSLDLGILASITREVALEAAARLGITVSEGVFPLERALAADEMMALSTVKEVAAVGMVDQTPMASGPVAAEMAAEYMDIVAEETGVRRRPGER